MGLILPPTPKNNRIIFAIDAARIGRDFEVNRLIVVLIFAMLNISRFSDFSPSPALPPPRMDLIHPHTPK
jgi:hypothetical protein